MGRLRAANTKVVRLCLRAAQTELGDCYRVRAVAADGRHSIHVEVRGAVDGEIRCTIPVTTSGRVEQAAHLVAANCRRFLAGQRVRRRSI